jgi:hypothetical protein
VVVVSVFIVSLPCIVFFCLLVNSTLLIFQYIAINLCEYTGCTVKCAIDFHRYYEAIQAT